MIAQLAGVLGMSPAGLRGDLAGLAGAGVVTVIAVALLCLASRHRQGLAKAGGVAAILVLVAVLISVVWIGKGGTR